MKKLCILLFVLFLAVIGTSAQDRPLDSPVFNSDAITFSEYPGLSFKLSDPYLCYQKWDTEHTGTPELAIALEFTNNSENAVSAIYFLAKLLDNEGGTLFHGTLGLAPMLCEPNPGNAFGPGYKGISTMFITRDQKYYGKTGTLDFSIKELKIPTIL